MTVNFPAIEPTYLGMPPEIKEHIREYLLGRDVLKLAQVNRELAGLYHDANEVTWRQKCEVEYPNQSLPSNTTWKRHYINLQHANLPFNRGYRAGFNNAPNLGWRIGQIVGMTVFVNASVAAGIAAAATAGVAAVVAGVAAAFAVAGVAAAAGVAAGATAAAVAGVAAGAAGAAGGIAAITSIADGVSFAIRFNLPIIINASSNLGENITSLSPVRKLCGMTAGSWEYLKSRIRE
ncbi:MAG: hypothetical protein K1060chlam5_00307 [Candidatus Anoxychlamydiales bacterium]|nr:hypothetical protein [Candidatus Anoxychlamydiales bacterium]